MHCRSLLLAAVGTLVFSACPGALENPERFLPADAGGPCTVDDVEPVIFANTCAGAGCHQTIDGGLAASNNLDLVSPGIRARVLAQVSSCNSKPMATYLVEKVKLSAATCVGSRMPLGKPNLSANQIACIEAWVAGVTDAGTSSDAGLTDGGT